jgi:bifunctional DNA-binding transcriptional regulator/antitoxin component of YhaV-PrlF toxin-antitoxin module
MAGVTSKYQVTVPRKIAEAYDIRPGHDIEWGREDLIAVAALVDTNIPVYRYDNRFPKKQNADALREAEELLSLVSLQ